MLSQETVKTNPTEEQKISLTLEEFLDWYPDGYEGRFELHDGEIVKMQPTGTHEKVAGFLASKISIYIDSLNLPFFIPRQGLIKAIDSDKSAYIPDVMVLDDNALEKEPLWTKRSTITQSVSIKLVIEVVSTNWRDDYLMKLAEYEKLGIGEYWIVDYLGLGGRRYIGDPKKPTISVYHLVEGEYELHLFRGENVVTSPTFPELNLTAEQIFKARQ
ncbi:Uma2 family endonuclease [Limnospira fusiformis KN01]|uniref:Uma2 family endonuclease n=1 Tax=Limnospira fusiformis PMC 851.14 TaxID=2219512 RepID=A0ABU9ESN3_LIMFS|nr:MULTISPECIES: Uma2 family endonuclease [Limnospira]MDC0840517.1 Uma2 family endonuclease [Limnoraphis robusta]MDY7052292.1 Uma2 family endonuclease [Limnospira fusiformis LS22]QJB28830.1 Uma2 family endonuclease [Limnospira fusiformis SAG 85.79]UWU51516.1 Endonuclease, Uma2 family (restriction endonuclease fold) [Arthrospira platensis C1]MDT9189627.1 Uma2 family endonuclease [Limnospira sp. PMC 894.15]